MESCKYCGLEFPNKISMTNHRRYCKQNPERGECNLSRLNRERNNLCKGLTKNNSNRYLKVSKALAGRKGHPWSEEAKIARSKKAKESGQGGYIPGSGRGIKGWYKGYWCDSSWELAYIIYCLDHQISIKRCKEKRQYILRGITKNYHPDFIVEGRIVEIKGWVSEISQAKQLYNSDILFLYQENLHDVFSYVHNIYGKDFVKLYEKEEACDNGSQLDSKSSAPQGAGGSSPPASA